MNDRVVAITDGIGFVPADLSPKRGADAAREPGPLTRTKTASYPVGRFGQAKEAVRAALFLIPDEPAFVPDAAFRIDGGITAI